MRHLAVPFLGMLVYGTLATAACVDPASSGPARTATSSGPVAQAAAEPTEAGTPSPPADDPPVAPVATPDPPPLTSPAPEPVTMPSAPPVPTPAPIPVVPVADAVTPPALLLRAEADAKADAFRRTGIPALNWSLVSWVEMAFGGTALGCPDPSYPDQPLVVLGYRLVIRAGSLSLGYNTNTATTKRCDGIGLPWPVYPTPMPSPTR